MKSTLFTLSGYLLVAAGATTLIPWSGASEPNVIGFRSFCTFAPFSSIICFMGANILFTLKKRQSKNDGE